MNFIEQFFIATLMVQIVHAIEEMVTGFHKKWYLFRMPFWAFFIFEMIFESFWIVVWLWQDFPNRTHLQAFFLILMFANGIQHVIWAGSVKRYVPGLITAPLHIVIFIIFYFRSIF